MSKPQVRYFKHARIQKIFSSGGGGGGGGHHQNRVGPAPNQWSRHKYIKMGRSWHIFLLSVHSEARFDDIYNGVAAAILR